MTGILLIVQIVLAAVITLAVLLQKSSVFGAKGPAGFLTKATFALGFLFLVNTVALGYFYAQQKNTSVVDEMVDKNNIVAPTINVVSDTNVTK